MVTDMGKSGVFFGDLPRFFRAPQWTSSPTPTSLRPPLSVAPSGANAVLAAGPVATCSCDGVMNGERTMITSWRLGSTADSVRMNSLHL